MIRFTKMQGLGNDYIYINTDHYPIAHPEELSRKLSRYHTGIGSDGLVLLSRSDKADFRMRIFNADGSEAQMCGNASRCIGKYVYERRLTRKKRLTLETMSGIKLLTLHVHDKKVTSITVDMGKYSAQPLLVQGRRGTAVDVGNPHCVFLVDNVMDIDLPNVGPMIENDSLFPNRTNVEFAQILPDGSVRMRVWERGSGITEACGTGACATAVAIAAERMQNIYETRIIMDGGTLDICLRDGHVYMTGPAEFVFDGTIHHANR